jgi:2-isopropylmalate synthase
VIERIKDLESVGYSFEAAEASFELLLREEMGERPHYFDLESWRVIVEHRPDVGVVSEATVKLHAKGERIVATGEGNGPVNALDNALGSRSASSTRRWPGSSWSTTRCASSAASTAPRP